MRPSEEDNKEIAALWKEVFGDKDEFIALFFERVYRSENTLVIKSGGKIVSALQMIPYNVKIDCDILPAAYVCGVCTHPSERGKGLMHRLMAEAMAEMRQRGFKLSFLIPAEPWLFDYYRKFGYNHIVNQGITILAADKNYDESYSNLKIVPAIPAHFLYFDKKQRYRRSAVLHEYTDFETIICDLRIEGGNVWTALENDTPVGIAFAKPVSKAGEISIEIKEILTDTADIRSAMLNHIVKTCDAPLSEYPEHPQALATPLVSGIVIPQDLFVSLMFD
jgi:predicted N-acetyltransferase YhbS